MAGYNYTLTVHEIWVEDGVVWLANDEDPYFRQQFRTREQVDLFIKELEKARDELWQAEKQQSRTI